jgi:hypothetical protein
VRVDDGTVESAVGVAERQARGNSAFDDELASMLGAVVSAAEDDELVRIVLVADFGAGNEVVDVEKDGVSAAGNGAAAAVAPHDLAANGRRDVLAGSFAMALFTHVGWTDAADVLRIA